MICPICEAKNVTVAHILGHGGAGKTKGFSNEEKQRRRERMKALNIARSAKKTNDMDEGRRTQEIETTTDAL